MNTQEQLVNKLKIIVDYEDEQFKIHYNQYTNELSRLQQIAEQYFKDIQYYSENNKTINNTNIFSQACTLFSLNINPHSSLILQKTITGCKYIIEKYRLFTMKMEQLYSKLEFS